MSCSKQATKRTWAGARAMHAGPRMSVVVNSPDDDDDNNNDEEDDDGGDAVVVVVVIVISAAGSSVGIPEMPERGRGRGRGSVGSNGVSSS